jgi:hypothetical protein
MNLDKETAVNKEGGRYTRDFDEESMRNMRRVRDQEMRDEIKELRQKNQDYVEAIIEIKNDYKLLRNDFDHYVQSTHEAIKAANNLSNATFVGRHFALTLFYLLGLIGTGIAAWKAWKE